MINGITQPDARGGRPEADDRFSAGLAIQHMQKAMTEMNLQLHHVVSDITGATGMGIIRAIIAGERDPAVLASMRDTRCHSSAEVIDGFPRHRHCCGKWHGQKWWGSRSDR
jgi:hypothetical protein